MKKFKRNGFTLIDALMGLLTTGVISMLCCVLLQSCFLYINMDTSIQQQFAILQLRQYLSIASKVEVDGSDLVVVVNHESSTFGYDRNRLVKRPGYQIFMENIDDAYFYNLDEKVYLSFLYQSKNYTFQVY